ncbi:two-component sensor histidine kinase [Planomonospora sp. ID91781]|uniref:sensor histidine kinase n=1 Tax=Planomonospora sp. ID91781 TaxID=2738135 RepID=UPI0018C3E85E|nr:histidine kinase [Planomonospora sp. ID91781]MBG0824643.1 two-component sensor histidine kinase [Planomonospora sp. ID91781]
MSADRIARVLAGIVTGTILGLAELFFVCLLRPAAVIPAARPAVDRAAARLVALERARLARRLGHGTPRSFRPAAGTARPGVPSSPAARRGAGPAAQGGCAFLAARGVLGVAGGYVCAVSLFTGGLFLFGGLWDLASGASDSVPLELPGVKLITSDWVLGLTIGTVALALAASAVLAVDAADRLLAGRFLGPAGQELMRRRIAELTATRSGIVRAVDDERRRIERDLHDGVQQRGVALAMLLGRARYDPDAARTAELVDQAYAESRRLLDELRSVAWRIYPTALDELGLQDALEGVAERSAVPVTVHYGLAGRPVSEVETALYFVAREAITNAVKHAGAHDILVVLTEDERTVSVVISDDGCGGADPSGGGLSGLARRVLALDGDLVVDSPAGGPTEVTARLPKAVPCE